MGLILGKIFSVLVIIGIGYGANKINVLPSEIEPHLNKMLFTIIIPGMLFSTITTKELDPELSDMTLTTLLYGVVMYLVFIVVGLILVKILFRNTPEIEPGVYVCSFSSFNTALIGFPIINSLFGSDALFLLVIINLIMTIYVFVFMPMVMNMGKPRDPNAPILTPWGFVKLFFKSLWSPSPVCVFIATGMLFMGLRFPGPIEECMTYIGNASTVISMLIVGIQLGRSNIREVFKKYKEVIYYAIKVILMPVICFFIINPLPIPTEVKVALLFTSTLPSGVTPAPLASSHGHDPAPAAEGIVITCIISLATMSLGALFLSGYYHL